MILEPGELFIFIRNKCCEMIEHENFTDSAKNRLLMYFCRIFYENLNITEHVIGHHDPKSASRDSFVTFKCLVKWFLIYSKDRSTNMTHLNENTNFLVKKFRSTGTSLKSSRKSANHRN